MGHKARAKREINELFVARIRDAFADLGAHAGEKRMFGGVAFMVRGHMSAGTLGDDLMARVGPEAYESSLQRPHARVLAFTGRPMRGFIEIAAAGIDTDAKLRAWVKRCLDFNATLDAK